MKIYSTAIINVPEKNRIIPVDAGHIGDHCLIVQDQFVMKKGSQINSGSRIVGNSRFEIGEYSTVGYNVVILTGTDVGLIMNDYAAPDLRKVVRGSIILGDRVFIGSGSVICVSQKNPTILIGDDVVVMANSYVDQNIQPNVRFGRWGSEKIIKPRT